MRFSDFCRNGFPSRSPTRSPGGVCMFRPFWIAVVIFAGPNAGFDGPVIADSGLRSQEHSHSFRFRVCGRGAVFVVPRAMPGSNLETHGDRPAVNASSRGRGSLRTTTAAARTTRSGGAILEKQSTRGWATRPICGGSTTPRCGRRTGRQRPKFRQQFQHHHPPSAIVQTRKKQQICRSDGVREYPRQGSNL